jgi:hypothetical protein
LLYYFQLQARVNVCQKQVWRVPIVFGQVWLEIGKYVQVGLQGVGFVEIRPIAAGPMKALAGLAGKAAQVYVVAVKSVPLGLAKILADNGYKLDGAEIAGAQGKICGRPPQQMDPFARRGF